MKNCVKLVKLLAFALFLVLPLSAMAADPKDADSKAAEETRGVHMLVIDPDPAGTHVRDTPGGKVIRTLAYPAKDNDEQIEMRQVKVIGQEGKWFKVVLADGSVGWMHGSVLGSVSTGTEDGDPWMNREPADEGNGYTIKSDLPLELLEFKADDRGTMAKVRFTDEGKVHEGWLPEQCLFSNPYAYFGEDEDEDEKEDESEK